ncbi:hypothetical protein [Deinococcus sp.]|uniref:hypothetical protein n=1 Tax=Deinococcus sp. TaxID=47478 RepID=UPI0025BD3D05|nr:hypothetical protein [Deinococcus sp.]
MKNFAPLLLVPVLAPVLAACHSTPVQNPDSYVLSGTIHGDWGQSPRLRLALVGTGLPKTFTNSSNIRQNVVDNGGVARSFGFDLPTFPNVVGVYQVVAFDDTNNNAKYDIGEPVARNRLWLIYSPTDTTTPQVNIPEQFPWAAGEQAIPSLSVKRGWNVYDRSQQISASNPYPASKITGYDIYH